MLTIASIAYQIVGLTTPLLVPIFLIAGIVYFAMGGFHYYEVWKWERANREV